MEIDPENNENKKGVKLDASKSIITNKVKEKELFEQKAIEANKNLAQANSKAAQLVKNFWVILKDTELQENKGPLSKNIEKEALNNLIEYARSLNNDENQMEDSLGSISLITLLFKSVLYQKDLLNNANYEINNLKENIELLKNELRDGLSKKVDI